MQIKIRKINIFNRFFYLLLTLISFASIVYVINMYSPQDNINFQIDAFKLSSVFLLYLLIFLFFLFLMKTLTRHFVHGLSLGIFVLGFLLLKSNNFFQPSLIGLLVLLIFVVEFAFWPKRNKQQKLPRN